MTQPQKHLLWHTIKTKTKHSKKEDKNKAKQNKTKEWQKQQKTNNLTYKQKRKEKQHKTIKTLLIIG